jgi:hypothetical protein
VTGGLSSLVGLIVLVKIIQNKELSKIIPVIALVLLASLTTLAWATVDSLHFEAEKEYISHKGYIWLFTFFLLLVVVGCMNDYLIACAYFNAAVYMYPSLWNSLTNIKRVQFGIFVCYLALSTCTILYLGRYAA